MEKKKTTSPKKSPKKSVKRPNEEGGVVRALLRNVVLAVSLLVIVLVVANVLLGIITRHGQNKDVPNFVGVTVEEAHAMAKKGRLEVIVNDSLYVPLY
ncbi:MAG: hypothetical protein IKY63_01360, partial [Tidjanibacter sp.]|nr:hypothetical protein [Tidjanibacter sp.]